MPLKATTYTFHLSTVGYNNMADAQTCGLAVTLAPFNCSPEKNVKINRFLNSMLLLLK